MIRLRWILPIVACLVADLACATPDLPKIPSHIEDAAAHGVVADGHTDNTAALQRLVDGVSAAGGGVVVLPAAEQSYRSGPIDLKSHVELRVAKGAMLQPLPYGTYPLSGSRYKDFISASRVTDVAITGDGVIDGDGEAWWTAFRADKKMPHRPYMVKFSNCERVLLRGVTFHNPPMFHVAFSGTDHVTADHVVIRAPEDAPNTDGIDPGGSHYFITHCDISTGDDNIAIKAGGTYCSDLVIEDCAFGTGHGLSVGGQSNSGLDGLIVRRCTFTGTTSGLRLKADPTQGGPVRNIRYEDLTMKDVQYPIVFYSYYNKVGNPGNGKNLPDQAAAWNANPPNSLDSKTIPSWRDITIERLKVTGAKGHSVIWGLPTADGLIANVTLRDVDYEGAKSILIYDATGVRFAGHLSVEIAKGAPAFLCYNALALRGQPADVTAAAGGRASFSVASLTTPGALGKAPVRFQWLHDGKPLADGPGVSGSSTETLHLDGLAPSAAGRYSVAVSTALDVYDPVAKKLDLGSLPSAMTSDEATLTVK